MGFLSKAWKSVKNVVKKVAPIASLALPFIPGVGALAGSAVGAVSRLFGGGSSSPQMQLPGEQEGAASFFGDYSGSPGSNGTFPLTQIFGSALGQIPWGSLASGGISYLGGQATNAANAEQAQKQMDFQNQQNRLQEQFQVAQNQKQMDFQERMRATQYQTATADMQAAGLNPMLAYGQGGAGTVGGSTSSGATSSGAQAQMANALGSGVSTAMQAMTTLEQVANMRATNEQIHAQTENIDADTKQRNAQTVNLLEELNRIKATTRTSDAQTAELNQRIRNMQQELLTEQVETKYREGSWEADVARRKSESLAAGMDLSRSRWEEKYYQGVMPDISNLLTNASRAAEIFSRARGRSTVINRYGRP